MKLMDMLGREGRTLADEYKAAGRHSITVLAEELASGVCFYQLTAGRGFSTAKKRCCSVDQLIYFSLINKLHDTLHQKIPMPNVDFSLDFIELLFYIKPVQ
jgi:hypothetical protein